MALFFSDLVREFSSSAGAGDFVLGGAVPGHRRFAETVPPGARFHYCIAGVTRPEEWETGEGQIGSGGALARSPSASSAEGALVAFSAGLKTVALTVAAAWFSGQDQATAIGDVTGLQAALDGKAETAHGHSFSELSGRPTTLAGYGITDAAPAEHGHSFAALSDKPSTLAGYGITDAAAAVHGHSYTELSGRPALGSLAAQDANAIAVTGGTIGGLASLGLAGTATSNAALLIDGIAGGVQTVRARGSGSQLAIEQTGGLFGTSRLKLSAETGALGATLETTHATAQLADLLFKTSAAGSHGIRYERRAAEMKVGNSSWQFEFGTVGAPVATIGGAGLALHAGTLRIGASQVVQARRTGWTVPGGTASRAGFATSTATTQQLAETLKALIDDLAAHGLIGA